MKVGQNYFPKSSFLSVDKNLSIVVNKILENQNICKMLYYTQRDCLSAPDLTQEQKISLINKQILIVPRLEITDECPNKILVQLTDFSQNVNNPEFRDCVLRFAILCHPDHWLMGNFQLRPYRIAGELDAMFDEKKMTGIGTLQFLGCDNLIMSDQLEGLLLLYSAIQGVEDKVNGLS